MKQIITTLLWAVSALLMSLQAQNNNRVFHCIVAQDGSGNFTTVQAAIDAAPDSLTTPYIIFIKAGHYREHLFIPASKPHVHLVGQHRNLVCVSDDRVSGGVNARPVDEAATLVVHATDVLLEGITFENSWGTKQQAGPQALALYTKADKAVVNRCAMRSYQDTYRTANALNHRNYVKDCLIEGGVDFIYGQGNVFFDRCTLYITRKQDGWIVAPKHEEGTTWGYVLKNTTITAPGNAALTRIWLGRPWRNNPMAVFINTKAEVTIPNEGWFDHMNGLPTVFADYNTTDAHGKTLDLSRRISRYYMLNNNTDTLWTTAKSSLTPQEVARYTVENVLSAPDNWQPQSLCNNLPAVKVVKRGTKLTWKPVHGARGYVVSTGKKVVAITQNCQCTVPDSRLHYTVQSVNSYGSLNAVEP